MRLTLSHGLLISDVAARCGVSWKALRLYEGTGILPPPPRTTAGYRVYGQDTLGLLVFVTRSAARFPTGRDQEHRGAQTVWPHSCLYVSDLVRMRRESIEQTLTDLTELRQQLRDLLTTEVPVVLQS